MTTVIVAGALANKPGNGGEAWVRMSWARGLARLGFDVWFVEALTSDRGDGIAGPDPRAMEFFDAVTRANALGDRSVLVVDGVVRGLDPEEWDALADDCALLVNISGHLEPDEWFHRIPHRAYVDLDPGYTQIWDSRGLLGDQVSAHTDHYTVGLNVGRPGCDLPTGDVRWRPTLQPVVLEDWGDRATKVGEAHAGPDAAEREVAGVRFTTVASWRGAFGPIEDGDRHYGVKAHEWRRFRALPALLPAHCFEAALAIHPADGDDRTLLESAGWHLEDPAERAGSLEAFRTYVECSDAEFSVAQGVYVETRSGWFSDRSARYLAAGRPVVVQDTGFRDTIPEGDGALAFETMTDAVAAVETIADDYARHSSAARQLAETHFDSDRVLGSMLEDLGVSP